MERMLPLLDRVEGDVSIFCYSQIQYDSRWGLGVHTGLYSKVQYKMITFTRYDTIMMDISWSRWSQSIILIFSPESKIVPVVRITNVNKQWWKLIRCILICPITPKFLVNVQNQGQIWNLLVLTISKHPLHVHFDQVLAEILSSFHFQTMFRSDSMTSDVFLFHVFYRQKMRIYFLCGKTHDNCQEHIRCQLNLKSLFWPDGVRHLWSMMKASSGDNWKGRLLLRSCSNVLSIAFNTERSDVKRFLLTSYCLSSSQTWVIFLPNRNFYEKSISYPAGSLKIRS